MRKLTLFSLFVSLFVIAFVVGGHLTRKLSFGAQGVVAPCPADSENGDVNGDGTRDVADAIYMMNWIFQGGPDPCALAAERGCKSVGVWTFRTPRGPDGSEGLLGVEFTSPEEDGMSIGVFRLTNPDPTLFGMFPDATTRSDFVGQRVRTGPDTWDYTYVGYGTTGTHEPGAGEIVWIMVFRGTMTLMDDCNSLNIPGRAEVYSGRDVADFVLGGEPLPLHDQDTDPRDGFPDADEEPVVTIDFEVTETRLPMLPPLPSE